MTTINASSAESLIEAFRVSGSPSFREDLVKAHLKLVRQIAGVHAGRSGSPVEDLCQVGAIGLLHAIDRFEPGTGRKFEAYAGACIAGEIQHYLRDLGQLVRIPRELQELRPRVVRATARLAQLSHRAPTPDEIALELDVPAEKVEEVLALEERGMPLSLDDDGAPGEEKTGWRYQLIDNRYRSFQLAAEDRIMLAQAMGLLRDVSREVIDFAFYQDLSQIEIAKRLGISQMQVSRRIKTALGELWKTLSNRLWD